VIQEAVSLFRFSMKQIEAVSLVFLESLCDLILGSAISPWWRPYQMFVFGTWTETTPFLAC